MGKRWGETYDEELKRSRINAVQSLALTIFTGSTKNSENACVLQASLKTSTFKFSFIILSGVGQQKIINPFAFSRRQVYHHYLF